MMEREQTLNRLKALAESPYAGVASVHGMSAAAILNEAIELLQSALSAPRGVGGVGG